VSFDRLPPGTKLNDGQDVVARPAASVLLLRDGTATIEVLMVRRAATLEHMAGYWVFPGGAATADDVDLRATAVRETCEEVGIVFGADDDLVLFSRWITPARASRRFDTHFFAARAPHGQEPEADGVECDEWAWLEPPVAIDAAERRELSLVLPTLTTLERLSTFVSVDGVLAAARSTMVEPVQPRIVEHDGRTRVVLPGDPEYI
jgi:8-oxo-dGTP pyrophosphatase MutT (NUDIX family)